MKTACSYAGSYGQTFEAFVCGIDRNVFAGVELIPDQSPNLYSDMDTARLSAIKAELRRKNLTALVHNVFYDINLVSLIPEVQAFALSVTEKVMRIAKQLDAPAITVHPGYMFPGWRTNPSQTERFWASAETAMTKLGDLGRRYGVRPLLENGSYHVTTASGALPKPLHVGVTADELGKLVDFGRSDVGVCLDFNKMIVSKQPLDTFLRRVGPAIEQTQVSSTLDYGAEWGKLKSFLNARERHSWVVLEGPTIDRHKQAQLIASD
jgi:sugar phosphate isomerase/epimerase